MYIPKPFPTDHTKSRTLSPIRKQKILPPMNQAYQEHYPHGGNRRFFINGSSTSSIIPNKEVEDSSLMNIIPMEEREDSSPMNPSTFEQSLVWKQKILPRSILGKSSTPKVSLVRKQKILSQWVQYTLKKKSPVRK